MAFVHLHNHTHYSLLDGLTRPEELVLAAKAQGAPAVAITDHGVMSGVIEFYQIAMKHDVRPILGCELYICEDRFEKNPQKKYNHLLVLAETLEGYHNLMTLVTKAHLEGFYYKPRIDHRLLKVYANGLIGTSSCLKGEIPEALLAGDHERARTALKRYRSIFGSENFFIELQDHPFLDDQSRANDLLLALAEDTKTPLVATNDSHYPASHDREAHDILICIQTGTNIHDDNRMKYSGDFSVRPTADMEAAFSHCPSCISNTVEVANRCRVELNFGQNLIPAFATPQNERPMEYLEALCRDGFRLRYGDDPSPEACDRLEYELKLIHDMGFDTYFLIVHDFVKFAKEKGIVVGPGRGSAAGSIISYCLEITDIDPLEYGLLFERFLNPERISMPDIDIDFADDRRDEVLDYVIRKYGRENVAQIITFGTMAARAAVRDTGRALGYPYAEVDVIAKQVPPPVQGRHIPLRVSIQDDPDLKKLYESDERAKILMDNAMKLEGTIRHAGTHACAVVIAKEALHNYTPLQFATGEDKTIVTEFSMKPIEEIGLLKMDFLGLKNLTILEKTLEIIERLHGVTIDLREIPMNDAETFKLLAAGRTTGVFQLESNGMKRYLKQLKPTEFNDIIAMNALYRPGPMEWIPAYIKGKHNAKSVHYLHASFKSILEETYGVAVYQEQILQLARDFAGFSLGEADILRKAVGKKDPKLLLKQREKFIKGAQQKGHTEKFAIEVFEKVIEPFAGYGFNKAHATCYAMIAYQTAYLKAHYPTEFMAALLTADRENTDRVVIEITECEGMGISVLPPNVNESGDRFTVSGDRTIRFGLAAIKGVGEATVKAIIEVREAGGRFANFENFAKRVPHKLLNKKTLEALAYAGAFDELGERRAIAENFSDIVTFAKAFQESSAQGQTDIFGMMADCGIEAESHLVLGKVNPATHLEKLNWEREYLGLYVSGHPLQGLAKYIAKKAHLIGKFSASDAGQRMTLCGLVSDAKKVMTKSGSYMAYMTLEDPTGRCNVVVFPKTYTHFHTLIEKGLIITVSGRLEDRRGEFQFVADEIKQVSLDDMISKARAAGFFDENDRGRFSVETGDEKRDTVDESVSEPCVIAVPIGTDKDVLKAVKDLLMENQGENLVEIHMNGDQSVKRIKVPFGVRYTPQLKERIEGLLSSA